MIVSNSYTDFDELRTQQDVCRRTFLSQSIKVIWYFVFYMESFGVLLYYNHNFEIIGMPLNAKVQTIGVS